MAIVNLGAIISKLNFSFAPTFILQIVGLAVSFLINIYLARLLGPDGYGAFAFALAMVTVFSTVASFGLDTFVVKWLGRAYPSGVSNSELSKFFLSAHVVIFLAAIGIDLVYLTIAKIFELKIDAVSIFMMAVPVLFSLLKLYSGFFRGIGKPVFAVSLGSIFVPVTFIILIGSLIAAGTNASLNLALSLRGAAVLLVWLVVLFVLFFSFRAHPSVDSENSNNHSVLRVISESYLFFLSSTLILFFTKSDVIFLKMTLTAPDGLGVYAASYNLAFMVILVLQTVSFVFSPNFSNSYSKNDREGLKNYLLQTQLLAGSAGLIIASAFFVAPRFFLGFFGEEYLAGATILRILAAGMLVNALCGSAGNLLIMCDRLVGYSMIILVATILQVVAIFVVVPEYGIIGASVVVSIIMVLWNLAALIYVRVVIANVGLQHGK